MQQKQFEIEIVRFDEVLRLTGLSRSTIERLVQHKQFPPLIVNFRVMKWCPSQEGGGPGYCGGGAAADSISDRSGAWVPHGCATTAEIEFCGEPLMNRSVHTTYTKLLCVNIVRRRRELQVRFGESQYLRIILSTERLLTRNQKAPDGIALPGGQGVSPCNDVVNGSHRILPKDIPRPPARRQLSGWVMRRF